eukprot:7635548-Karenia_brevis.AAC.1
MGENGQLWNTRAPIGKDKSEGSQIDYLFISGQLRCRCGVGCERRLRSDHFAVWARLFGHDLKFQSCPRAKSTRGWQPKTIADLDFFRAGVASSVGLEGSPANDCMDLNRLQHVIETTALSTPYATLGQRQRQRHRKPQELKDAEA